MNEYLCLLFINSMLAITLSYPRNRKLVDVASRCVHRLDNILRRFRNDLYLGDQPIVPDRSKLQIANDRPKALERVDDLKKRRKTKESKRKKKKRKRPAQAKSSRLPATRLNETVVSQLDISCFAKKIRGKGLIKAPLIEHSSVKYARFVHI